MHSNHLIAHYKNISINTHRHYTAPSLINLISEHEHGYRDPFKRMRY